MYRTIKVYSRSGMIQHSHAISTPCVIVSISGRGEPEPSFAKNANIKDVLYMHFGDSEQEPECITRDDAEAIAAFVKEHRGEDLDMFFHCDAGVSRSAGCAAATMLVEFGDDSRIFNDGQYRPNMKCYRRVLDSFDVSSEDIERARIRFSELNSSLRCQRT